MNTVMLYLCTALGCQAVPKICGWVNEHSIPNLLIMPTHHFCRRGPAWPHCGHPWPSCASSLGWDLASQSGAWCWREQKSCGGEKREGSVPIGHGSQDCRTAWRSATVPTLQILKRVDHAMLGYFTNWVRQRCNGVSVHSTVWANWQHQITICVGVSAGSLWVD